MNMKPRLTETRVDCLNEMAADALILIRQEDLYTADGQMAVLQYAWDLISAMPNLDHRHYWISRITDALYARNPHYHRDYYFHGVLDGVKRIRQAKGLPV